MFPAFVISAIGVISDSDAELKLILSIQRTAPKVDLQGLDFVPQVLNIGRRRRGFDVKMETILIGYENTE